MTIASNNVHQARLDATIRAIFAQRNPNGTRFFSRPRNVPRGQGRVAPRDARSFARDGSGSPRGGVAGNLPRGGALDSLHEGPDRRAFFSPAVGAGHSSARRGSLGAGQAGAP